MADERSKIHDTPNGGVRSTIYYRDKDGNPADESVAVGAEIIEYDKDGEEIFRTYLERKPNANRKERR